MGLSSNNKLYLTVDDEHIPASLVTTYYLILCIVKEQLFKFYVIKDSRFYIYFVTFDKAVFVA